MVFPHILSHMKLAEREEERGESNLEVRKYIKRFWLGVMTLTLQEGMDL